jgi:hypothetical protein
MNESERKVHSMI